MSTRTWHGHEQVWQEKRGWRCIEKCYACAQVNMFYPGDPISEKFSGSDYVPVRDDGRLTEQVARVYYAIKDGQWRTVTEIRALITENFRTVDPETSISAQLRNLRKKQFGDHNIIKRRRPGTAALYEYSLAPKEQ